IPDVRADGGNVASKVVSQNQRKFSGADKAQETPPISFRPTQIDRIDGRRLDEHQRLAVARRRRMRSAHFQLDGVGRFETPKLRDVSHGEMASAVESAARSASSPR